MPYWFLIIDSEIKTPETQGTPTDNLKQSDHSNNGGSAIGFQTCSGINGDQKKELMSSLFLNNYLNPNTPNSKTDSPAANPILIPYIQNSSQTQQNNSSAQSNLSQLALAQFLAQNMKIKPIAINGSNNGNQNLQSGPDGNISFNMSNKAKQLESLIPNQNNEAFMREFQNRILGLLITQNKMLIDLKDKNEILQDTLECLINEISTIK